MSKADVLNGINLELFANKLMKKYENCSFDALCALEESYEDSLEDATNKELMEYYWLKIRVIRSLMKE